MAFLGIGVGILAAPVLGSVGAGVLGGAVGGAGISAITSAAQGKPITAKDMLIGTATGAATGGVGGALAAPAKVATDVATNVGTKAVEQGAKSAVEQGTKAAVEQGAKSAVEQGAKSAVEQGTSKGVAGLQTLNPLGPQATLNPVTPMSPVAAPTPLEPIPTSDILGTGISTGSKTLDKVAGEQAVSGIMKGGEQGLGAIQTAQYNQGVKKADQQAQAAGAANAGLGQNMANDLYSNQIQAPMLAKGGQVHMDSGSFVIPADIVSALGDGSTEAGFRFLESFFKDAGAE